MRTRKHKSLCVSTESLEIREVKAAAITATLSASGVLVVDGTDNQDIVHVVSDNTGVVVQRCLLLPTGSSGALSEMPVGIVQISVSGRLQGSVQRSQVHSLLLSLGKGDDRVTLITDLNSTVCGGAGNDLLIGGSGKDTMYGDVGNDKLYGGIGCDVLRGGEGDDRLNGGNNGDLLNGDNGNDEIYGGSGDDQIIGGSGRDAMYGQEDSDTLIAIDGAFSDWADGGNGADVLWIDSAKSKDTASNLSSQDVVQRVSGFQNGVDLSLDGDRIDDPFAPKFSSKNFGSMKLFSDKGPSVKDINQGSLGDCWLMSTMGEIALKNPQIIRANIVDFCDGTFGVHLGDKFYRIDSDLPVDGKGNLVFAGLGSEKSAWAALYEKAFAYHRSETTRRYSDLTAGWSTEAFEAFGIPASRANLNEVSSVGLLEAMNAGWAIGGYLTVTSKSSDVNSVLANNHVYMVVGFVRSNVLPTVTAIKLRNPWGKDDGTLNDGSDDGFVTLSVADFLKSVRAFEFGQV